MRRLEDTKGKIPLELDGHTVEARAGEPLAASLLAADEHVFSRSPKYHRPRGPYCLEGACAQCLMRVDGVPNVQTCRTEAKPGMRVERQNAFPSVKVDLLAATDWLFPRGLNHHELFAGVPIVEQVMQKVARELSGLGSLPDKAMPVADPPLETTVEVAIVGGGPAGLAAAQVLTGAGVPFLLLERERALGGRLRTEPPLDAPLELPEPPDAQVRRGAAVVASLDDQRGHFLAVVEAGRLHKVRARTVLFANGGVPQLLPFADNDLPGIFAGRAVSALIRLHAILPGQRIACVGDLRQARPLARLVEKVGGEAVAVGAEPVEAHGRDRVTGLTVRLNGREEKVGCDAVAVCAPASPAFELARHAGVKVGWRQELGLFVAEADEQGRTARHNLFVAGELLGPLDAAGAAESGRRAAHAILEGRS